MASIVAGRASPDPADEGITFRLPLSSDTSVHYYVDRDTSSAYKAWNGTTQTYNGHTGSDFSGGPRGRAIYAAADGILIARVDGYADYSGPTGGAGNYITLNHGNDRAGNPITTTYMHMASGTPINLPIGSFVAAGTEIGGVGASGGATGLHLHFHMTYDGVRYDPFAKTGSTEVSWWNNQGSGSPSTATPAKKFRVGDHVDVFAVGATTLVVRGPAPNGPSVGSVVDGMRGQVIEGAQLSYLGTTYNTGVYTRYKIQFENGLTGWVAHNWLKLSPGPTAVAAVTPTNGKAFLSNSPLPRTLDFTDSPNATSYDVYLDGVLKANVATSSYTMPAAPAYGSHTWSVTARSAAGVTPSATFNFYIGVFLPGQAVKVNSPTGLKAWNTCASNGTYIVKPDGVTATVISGPVFAVDNWRWELRYAGDTVNRWSAEGFLLRVAASPVLNATASPTLSPVTVGANEAVLGDAVSDIIVDGSITDSDRPGAAPADIENIAVTSVNNTFGVWQYSIDEGVTWLDFSTTRGAIANLSGAVVLAAANRVRFLVDDTANPGPGASQSTFTFRAWDGQGYQPGDAISSIPGQSNTYFSDASDTAVVAIHVVTVPAWVPPEFTDAWDAATRTFSVTGPVEITKSIDAAPGEPLPILVADGPDAVLTLNPTDGFQMHLGALYVLNGAAVVLAPGGAVDRVLIVEGELIINSESTLDLADNAMIAKSTSLADIKSLVTAGYHNGDFAGIGITSSAARNDPAGLTAIGYASNAELAASSFEGVAGLDSDDILIKYTYFGDADLNGIVDPDDFNSFLAGFQDNSLPRTWVYGDFDYNGVIDPDDFNLFLAAFQLYGPAV